VRGWLNWNYGDLGRVLRRGGFVILVLGLVGILGQCRSSQLQPVISLHFTGKVLPGLNISPFTEMVLTNESKRAIQWSRGGVEAPEDPDSMFGAGFDSNIPMGTLGEGASTNFPALIPHRKGVRFRVLVNYVYEPNALDRLGAKLARVVPGIDLVWPPLQWQTYTSEWYRATVDYDSTGARGKVEE
jgi:hypothetical protein